MINIFMTSKKQLSQKTKSIQNQKSLELIFFFFTNFKGKKTHNKNFPHQKE